MKSIKKKIVALFLAIALLATGFAAVRLSIGSEVSALAPGYNGEPDTVYYFFDYYPTLPYSTMEPTFGSRYNIVYDRYNGARCFDEMVKNGYFEGFGSGCYVIIDIKTFMPQNDVLEALFLGLKNQECKTAFVSIYDESVFNKSFLSNVDKYVKDDFSALKGLINTCLTSSLEREDLIITDETEINNCYFLDENLIPIFPDIYMDFGTLCEYSIFLKLFVAQFRQILRQYMWVPEDNNEFAELLSSLNIKFLVYYAQYGVYIDILKFKGYFDPYGEENYDVSGIFAELTEKRVEYFCGFGFWELSSTLYNTLLEGQGECNNGLPVYIIEADPIIYADSGLVINTYSGANPGLEDLMGWIGS